MAMRQQKYPKEAYSSITGRLNPVRKGLFVHDAWLFERSLGHRTLWDVDEAGMSLLGSLTDEELLNVHGIRRVVPRGNRQDR